MSQSPTLTVIEEENGPQACALGMLLLMLALACAIAIAISPLTPFSSAYGSTISLGVLFLILFSLGGGYLASSGLLFILRESRRADSNTQD